MKRKGNVIPPSKKDDIIWLDGGELLYGDERIALSNIRDVTINYDKNTDGGLYTASIRENTPTNRRITVVFNNASKKAENFVHELEKNNVPLRKTKSGHKLFIWTFAPD